MNKAYLMIGGNEGDRFSHLRQARSNLELCCGELIQQSSLYETAPWGNTNQAMFINQALLLQTTQNPTQLMENILNIEQKMGRKRAVRYGPRSIDIDILFFNNEIISIPMLTVPHPEIQNRRFVLEPMNEIAASYIHPVLHKSITELLRTCPDPLTVKKIIE